MHDPYSKRLVSYARLIGTISGAFTLFFLYAFSRQVGLQSLYPLIIVFSIIAGYNIYRWISKRARLRRQVIAAPFPLKWRAILDEYVAYYRDLEPELKHDFEKDVQIFIAEKKITGVDTDVTDLDRILVASSAIIPIFGFRDWEYYNLHEILLYSSSFNSDYRTRGYDRYIQGMVGTGGGLDSVMLLSKPDLHANFSDSSSPSNVGIHEFIHLIDRSDGRIDGIPKDLLSKMYVLPWLNLIHNEISRIETGASDINPYAAMNEKEFFAVAGEYFFKNPQLLKENHPDLYNMLKKIFRQDLLTSKHH